MAEEPTSAESAGEETASEDGGARYPFLSAEWTEEAKKLQQEIEGTHEGPVSAQSIRMNLVVTQVPFGDGDVDAHLDTSSGSIHLGLEHLEDPELKVTLDYATAKAILVEGNFQVGMQAFMAGKVKVEGDMSKLLQLQASPTDPHAVELAARIKAITAD
jgi:putative sterol carrier protein